MPMRCLTRFTLVSLALLALALTGVPAHAQGKQALLIVASSDFEASEYSQTRSALEGAGVTCTVASTRKGTLRSNKSLRVSCDMALSEVQTADYDAVVVIGGNGIMSMWKNSDAHRIVQEAASQDKIVAAICAGPGILAYSGVLQGKKATCYPRGGTKSAIMDKGGRYTGSKVEVDGKFITANGPQAASAFGQAIVAAF